MDFRPYMHIERFGNDEVQGIELGKCYVFPKIDGTNASVWLSADGISCGSRRRELTVDEDNAGFCRWATVDSFEAFDMFFDKYPFLRLYGEWLVPHSLKTYREDAWRKFYIFDVYDCVNDIYLDYDFYMPIIDKFGFDYVPPLCVMNNATYDSLLIELNNNGFLIKDGCGVGEGIVIKNYDFANRFGRIVWAKIVTNEFKEKHTKELGPTVKNMKEMVESEICEKYVTKHLVDKTYSKIVNECGGWNSKYIPRLLNTVYYDLVNEECWNFVKANKNPTINFKTLNGLCINKIKQIKPELF